MAAPPAPLGPSPATVWVVAWLIPGAGHAMVGQLQKAGVFFFMLTLMFVVGLAFGGRLFPLQLGDILLFLAALAEWALGAPRAIAAIADAGEGSVTAITYEYGNTFLIAAGLLNLLVSFNAMDVARMRRAQPVPAPARK